MATTQRKSLKVWESTEQDRSGRVIILDPYLHRERTQKQGPRATPRSFLKKAQNLFPQ